ncbi:MAG: hypothetical protein LBH70_10660 [Spirochaetaceae bacterium]|nr:hypothetical protein [Spirochaetaceae bacterium]
MLDRYRAITRHNPVYHKVERDAPLSVGNGAFCYTADFTGLQTFFNEYNTGEDAFPLCTMAEWGWHSYADAPKDDSALRLENFDTWGRNTAYAVDETGQEALFRGLRQNAHKFHLGIVGLERAGGAPLSLDNTKAVTQELDLWEGVLRSEFTVKGIPVKTETFVHPGEDTLYLRLDSPLLKTGELSVVLRFPYGSHKKAAADLTVPALHRTEILRENADSALIRREMDGVVYRVIASFTGLSFGGMTGEHTITLKPRAGTAELAVSFEPLRIPAMDIPPADDGDAAAGNGREPQPFALARRECAGFWENYWKTGGAVDFSGSDDDRAFELERRIVLSRYLTAIQSRGNLPPAETGLACNSWYGKFHLEMTYWHSAHFALWGKTEALKKLLAWYKKILPSAREIAASQGYRGARWPKMCDPTAYNTPSSIAVLLIWQQPHPIMLILLCRLAGAGKDFLREYRDIIFETAEFMLSFIHEREAGGELVLGPPYIPAQERHDPRTVMNAAYELEYFRWGLKQADALLGELGEAPRFTDAAGRLALPAQKDGVYLAHENCPGTFTTLPFFTDHPSMLAMYGVLDSDKIDGAVMSATLDKVLAAWDMDSFYGWDFPMMAMTACRLGRTGDAVDLLLMDRPKNTYLPNGHNRQTGNAALPLYLPGNGGLLLASAMMAAGFAGKPGPLFPKGFQVQTEGLYAYI